LRLVDNAVIILGTTLADTIIMHPTMGFSLPTFLANFKILLIKPHPDSEVEFWHVGNLTACGTSPSQGEV